MTTFKKIMTLATLAFSLLVAATVSTYAGEKVEIIVKGMVCSFCSQGITKKFKEQEAVKTVDVSLEKHLVTLELNENKSLEDKAIENLLKDAGYNVEKIVRK